MRVVRYTGTLKITGIHCCLYVEDHGDEDDDGHPDLGVRKSTHCYLITQLDIEVSC